MNFQELLNIIYPYFIAILPSLAALGSIIAVAFKVLKAFSELKQTVNDKTDLQEARAEMNMIIQQNSILRKDMSELITQISKVKYDD